ncbi:MAG: chemotaxis protein CheW [Arenicella sp.]|nr:chemotaxis protein CheW [Arenicella sp.]
MKDVQDKSVSAWLLRINGHAVCVGASELSMLLEAPKTERVLAAPAHCREVMLLEANLYPVVDMSSLLKREPVDSNAIALIIYKEENETQASYGALRFDSIPERIMVTDDMQIDMDAIDSQLRKFVRAAFKYEDQSVGVLDLSEIFSLNNF